MKKFFTKILITIFFMSHATNSLSVTWTNWGLNQKCEVKEIYKPSSKKELISFVKKANKEKTKLRVVASGHSWSDIVCTDGYLIDLSKINKVLNIDKKNKTIKVEAGITIRDLNKTLANAGLALPNQAAIDLQTIAGATSTATHGTGHTGTLSSFIKEIELISADGKLHKFSDKTNTEYAAAARVSIGSLGIIYSLTLQCESAFYTKDEYSFLTLQDIIKDYKKLHKENDFFMFTWDPYADKVTAHISNKASGSNPPEKNENSPFELSQENSTTPAPRRQETEIAIKFTDLPEVLNKLKTFFESYDKQNIRILGDVLCRFVNAETNTLISPAVNRDCIFISINMLPSKNHLELLKAFEDLLFEFEGRPHWGKINFLDYNKAFKLYGNNLKKFIEIKNKLDPNKIFSNSYVEKVFKDI